MLLIVPSSSSLARMSRAGTPMASEKLRTVQGSTTITFSRRGAAVLAPVRRMCVRLRTAGVAALFLVLRLPPPDGGGLLAFQLPLLAAAEGDGALFVLRRPPRDGRRGAGAPVRQPAARRAAAAVFSGGGSLRGEVLAASAASRFCSCLRMCSESGFVPALPARMASSGSLMSGFCGAGSAAFGRCGRPRRGRQGGQLDRRPLLSSSPPCFSFSFSLGFSFPFSPLLFRSPSAFGFSFGLSARAAAARRSGGRRLRLLLQRRRASRAWQGRTGTLPGTVPAGAM